jgi:hypothetical protein
MHAGRARVVRRSSSIMPMLERVARQAEHPRCARTPRRRSDLVRAVHLGLDDVAAAGAAVAHGARCFRSCIAHRAVTMPSMMPSGISLPSASSTASVVIMWPTLRTSIRRVRERQLLAVPAPCRPGPGSGAVTISRPPFCRRSSRSPFIRPHQLRRPRPCRRRPRRRRSPRSPGWS